MRKTILSLERRTPGLSLWKRDVPSAASTISGPSRSCELSTESVRGIGPDLQFRRRESNSGRDVTFFVLPVDLESLLLCRGAHLALNLRALSNVGGGSARAGIGLTTTCERLGRSSLAKRLRPRGVLIVNDSRAATGILGADPPTMSSSQILQHLYSLDTSSPDISRLIYGLIRHDEEDQYLSRLRGPELTRLVDFLDKVRTFLSAFRLITKQTLQALSAVPTTDDVSRQCLRRLQVICGDNLILPSSYTVAGDLARVGDEPVGFGGFADVWEGTYCARKVCIKVLRAHLSDDDTLKKVRIRTRTPFFCVY